MPLKFPATIETQNGYRSLVTNPVVGCFLFHLLNPTPYKTFQWYTPEFDGVKNESFESKVLDNVEAEVLMTFFQLNEIHPLPERIAEDE